MIQDFKIAIDARMINRSGIGTCIKHWIKDVGYQIALGNPDELKDYSHIKKIPFLSGIYGYKEQFKFPYRLLYKEKPDVLHIPHCNVPLFYKGKMIVTVHDLTHLIYPEFLPFKLAHLYFKFIFWFLSKRANKIIVDSQSTKKDLLHFCKVLESKIEIIPLGVGEEFICKSPTEYEYLYQKFHISPEKKILLYVGNLLPHKNLKGLLKAFALMEDNQNYELILVGKSFEKRGSFSKEAEFNQPNIIYAGMVSQEDLVNLYNLADLFVLPSLYEGFGLPILEAFACGTPVACSNTSSMPEVGGHLAKYFDPQNPTDMAKSLVEALKSSPTKEELISYAKQFNWKNSANQIFEIAKNLCKKEQ